MANSVYTCVFPAPSSPFATKAISHSEKPDAPTRPAANSTDRTVTAKKPYLSLFLYMASSPSAVARMPRVAAHSRKTALSDTRGTRGRRDNSPSTDAMYLSACCVKIRGRTAFIPTVKEGRYTVPAQSSTASAGTTEISR